jgi:integral membrane protein (TIGR01906 family)
MNRIETQGLLYTMLRGMLVAVLPLVITLGSLRLALTPAYVWLSYHVPGFPEDSYGFTLDERLHWSGQSLAYLENDAGIDFLGDLTFEDGSQLFNDRELRHMQDVKRLTQAALGLWMAVVIVGGVAGLGLYWMNRRRELGRALVTGGRLTIALMIALAVALAISFPFVFVGFHHLFFQGNSWLFFYSDTLIRLFPERFWQQVFAFLVLCSLLISWGFIAVGLRLTKVGSDLKAGGAPE